ncbi:hypothetical protein EPIR_2604 [Erwinia piriflorinigrans CFBP 5888]|uniref:Uncharacterized protein n=1 Tax=Erwinia piriflorinigrans CFBP 5888 TaxID=1161919 RepID=V5Z9C7_9GAMM|nr:hypothetical protein EPIR_2604 [Erwinia piriflorinigrans CFBP 5888]
MGILSLVRGKSLFIQYAAAVNHSTRHSASNREEIEEIM